MQQNKLLSFVLPSRNNLEYLKIAYKSIRDNSIEKHWICFADDCSKDGTKQWLKEIKAKDDRVKYLVNESRDRIGHTFLYDEIIDKLVETEIFVIWHADMYMLPNADKEFMNTDKHNIVSLTRIEPPLHPNGPEKIQMNFGTDANSFREDFLLKWYKSATNKQITTHPGTTDGVFAPWACYKSTFQEIGGHDWLFIPQSKEDSDIFNRFKLYGLGFIQTWHAHCYHFTSRGSRFNPHLTSIGKNSNEWNKQNIKSTRNFIRKWGCMVKHTMLLNPIIPPKRDIGLIIETPNLNFIGELEPYVNSVKIEGNYKPFLSAYLEIESHNTLLNIKDKFLDEPLQLNNDVLVTFSGKETNDLKEIVSFLENFDYYMKDKNEYEGTNFTVRILRKRFYETDNIYLDNIKKYNNKYSNLKIRVYE